MLARISHQPSATPIKSSRHSKGIRCSSTLKCEYTPASDSRRETPGLTGALPSRDEVGEKAGLGCYEVAPLALVESTVSGEIGHIFGSRVSLSIFWEVGEGRVALYSGEVLIV